MKTKKVLPHEANANEVSYIETRSIIQNIRLNDFSSIQATRVTTETEITMRRYGDLLRGFDKKILNTKTETLKSELSPINSNDIEALRNNKDNAYFLLKCEGKFFVAKIPKDASLMSCRILGHHKCASIGEECKRLSAASDEDGGCKKVRNRVKRLEDYPWIISGYQTIGCKYDNTFVVVNCLNYEKEEGRKKTLPEKKEAKEKKKKNPN